MSFKTSSVLLLALALPLSACVGETRTASRAPNDTRVGGPNGDQSGTDPSKPNNDVGNTMDEPGPAVPGPGPGWSGTREDPPEPPTGGDAGPNGAAPGGSSGPQRTLGPSGH